MGFLSSVFGGGLRFGAATPENPRFALNSPQAWDSFFDGGPTPSGVAVNKDKALTLSPWWRGVNLICKSIAKVPLCLFEEIDGGKRPAKSHPVYRLVKRQPNNRQTPFEFWYCVMYHRVVKGNGLAYIDRVDGVQPRELWPVSPDTVTPVIETWDDPTGGKVSQLWYVVQINNATRRKIPAEDMLHFRGLSEDGIWGKSLLQSAKDTLGLGIGGRNYQQVFFKNSGRPSVVIVFPDPINAQTRREIAAEWERMHGGIENSHKTAVLDRGAKLEGVSTTAEDAQLSQLLAMNARDVANFLEIPPHKVGDVESKSFASNEQEDLNFLTDCIDPYFVSIEQQCESKLLTEAEREDDAYCFEFHRLKLQSADMNATANFLRTATGGKPWLTQNEARKWIGFDPADEGTADELGTPLNMGKGGMQNEPADPAKDNTKPTGPNSAPNDALKAQAPFLAETARRMIRRVGAQAAKAATSCEAFGRWADTWSAENLPAILEAFSTVRGAIAQAGGSLKIHPANSLVDGIGGTIATILDTATAKTLADSVSAEFSKLSEWLPNQLCKECLR